MSDTSRKQRYRLDIDDVIARAFLTKKNSDELIQGLNESTTDKKFALVVGGTNNPSWDPGDDRQFVMFDNATKSLKPSGYVVPVGAQSIQMPYITGALYKEDGVDHSLVSGTAIDVVTQNLVLPDASQWVDIHLTFQTSLGSSPNNDINTLQVLFGADTDQDAGVISTIKDWHTSSSDDGEAPTLVAIGKIPEAHILDNPLVVRVRGIPNDVPAKRVCVTRVGYRGTVDVPPAVVKGQHHYFAPVLLKHTSWNGGRYPAANWNVAGSDGYPAFPYPNPVPYSNWQTITLPGVPTSASAAILSTYGSGRNNLIEVWTKPTAIWDNANKLMVYYMETGSEDHAGHNSQVTVPIGSSGGNAQILMQGIPYALDYYWYKIFLIGYVS